MQTYHLSGSNQVVIRVEDAVTGSLTLYLEDMTTLVDTSQSLSAEYTSSESLLKFTPTIPSASEGDDYRAWITNGNGDKIWYGTFQVFTSQSLDKSNYTNQLTDDYKSNVTENEYIIY
jgi:hypothetical protein